MGIILFAFIIGSALAVMFSLLASLKDSVFATQIALAIGTILELFALGLLVVIAIHNLGGL